jgi:hypothetical protein
MKTAKTPMMALVIAVVLVVAAKILFGPIFSSTSNSFHPDSIAISKNSAYTIIYMLEQFKNDTGSYPASLSELVPSYCNEVPPPQSGEFWNYKTDGDQFFLAFGVRNEWGNLYPSCSYNSKSKDWYNNY